MKLLVSDYDGTIKTYDNNPSKIEKYIFFKNIKAINDFCNDNKFVIATGRNTSSIYNETKKYNILYNYLISYNGRVIVDKNKDIINAQYIDNNFLQELNNINIKKLSLFNEFGEAKSDENLIYIYLTPNSIKSISNNLNEWRNKYPNLEISYDFLFNSISIRKKCNKLLGIKELLKIENDIKNEDIVVVGDEMNDKDMIEYFNGYRMLISNPGLIFSTNNVVTSVHKLIKKVK